VEHVLVDLEVAEPAIKDLKALEGDCIEVEDVLERNVLNFRQVGKQSLVKHYSLIIPPTRRIILTGQKQGRHKIMMLIPSLEVFNQDRKRILIIQSDFMRHKLIPFIAMLVDFERIGWVFEVDVLKRRFVDADLLEN
jgi:hypothetical protein